MAGLTVASAGTSAVNGDYTENGTYNSAAAYEQNGGGAYWVWWHDGTEYWVLSEEKGDTVGMADYYTSEGVSPLTSSHAWAIGTLGGSPAPTVTESGGGGGSTEDLGVNFYG